jgi:hypothetical protein
VDWKGQNGENGTEQAQSAPNVVPFPRDWLGPREELVPFGPAASGDAGRAPPSASDFWSEDSAAVQEPELVSPSHNGRVAAPRRMFPPRGMVVAALAGVVALTALLTTALVRHARSAQPGIAHSAAAGPLTLFAGFNSTVVAGADLAGRIAARRWPQPRPVAHRTAATPRSTSRGTLAQAAQAAASSSPAPTPTPRTSTQVAQVVPQQISPAPQVSHAVAASGTHSTTGARTPPAFGASGALGPGHSPNG